MKFGPILQLSEAKPPNTWSSVSWRIKIVDPCMVILPSIVENDSPCTWLENKNLHSLRSSWGKLRFKNRTSPNPKMLGKCGIFSKPLQPGKRFKSFILLLAFLSPFFWETKKRHWKTCDCMILKVVVVENQFSTCSVVSVSPCLTRSTHKLLDLIPILLVFTVQPMLLHVK